MPVLTNIGVAATCKPGGLQREIHPIPDAAIAWEGETLRWVGPERDLPAKYRGGEIHDAARGLVIPGLVDCHTHLAFGGWRAGEFEARLLGRSYLEIARAGGGIASTVASTRAADSASLLARCRQHLREMVPLGVTTVEAKSGYGLTLDDEIRLLEIYRALAAEGPARIVPTLLAAHVVPVEYRDRRAEYVRLVVEEIIPRAAAGGLARFCDVFVEESAFTVDEARRILAAGKALGLTPKVHADQLSACGGAELAAEMGAASADHLEQVSDGGIRRMGEAGVVAVSLPFASLYLNVAPLPARRLIEAGVSVAVATDFNPGSAPSYHLPFALTLACTLQRMTPAESLKGATILAARAIGLEQEIGSLEPGKSADFAVIEADSVEQWLYHLRANACTATYCRGQRVFRH